MRVASKVLNFEVEKCKIVDFFIMANFWGSFQDGFKMSVKMTRENEPPDATLEPPDATFQKEPSYKRTS